MAALRPSLSAVGPRLRPAGRRGGIPQNSQSHSLLRGPQPLERLFRVQRSSRGWFPRIHCEAKGPGGGVATSTTSISDSTARKGGTVIGSQISHFDSSANDWWNLKGGMYRPLHKYVKTRADFVCENIESSRAASPAHKSGKNGVMPLLSRSSMEGLTVLDVGCGGGILSEEFVKRGAAVVGVDASSGAIEAAKCHRDLTMDDDEQIRLTYRCCELLDLPEGEDGGVIFPKKFDIVVASEVIEHVNDPAAFVAQLADRAKEGGLVVLTTINKTWAAWLVVIVAAEYIMKLIEKGTHFYHMLISPSLVESCGRTAGLNPLKTQGTMYLPWPVDRWFRVPSAKVNYMIALKKTDAAETAQTSSAGERPVQSQSETPTDSG